MVCYCFFLLPYSRAYAVLVDTSVLPSAVSNDMLSAPPSTAPAFLAVAISFSFIFFVAYTLLSFRHKLPGGFAGKLDKPIIARLTAWVGVFGFMIGEDGSTTLFQSLQWSDGLSFYLQVSRRSSSSAFGLRRPSKISTRASSLKEKMHPSSSLPRAMALQVRIVRLG